MKNIAGPEWMRTAKERTKWKALEEAFDEGKAVKEKPVTDLLFESMENSLDILGPVGSDTNSSVSGVH